MLLICQPQLWLNINTDTVPKDPLKSKQWTFDDTE